jgi:guanidinopropionase
VKFPISGRSQSGRRGDETKNVRELRWAEAPAYFSFDIDALDPAYAPGTGTPEPGGLTTLEAQRLIRDLGSLDFVGADLVEVSPPFDTGGITSMTAVVILFELLCVLAQARIRREPMSRG